jgi:hypothetical protein
MTAATSPQLERFVRGAAPRAAARICRPGDTCWLRLPARRIAFLVDAEDYYAALHETLLAAESRVWIVGWDVNASTQLRPGGERLGPFLDFLAGAAAGSGSTSSSGTTRCSSRANAGSRRGSTSIGERIRA